MRRTLSLMWMLLACATCVGQQATVPNIYEVADHAGIIFRGVVIAVVPEPARAPGEIGVLRITFRVDDGIRGAGTGQTITIRQWNNEPDEYRVGESLVLFLYAPSDEMGLTSPVAGRAGHRRPDEIAANALQQLRTQTFRDVAPAPTQIEPPVVPKRPKKLPKRAAELSASEVSE